MVLDDDVRRLATGANFATLTTLLADGTPQSHVMWVDADDEHLLINTEVHRAKYRNLLRDPRATVTVWERDDPYRFVEVRGRAVAFVTGPEARAHIDTCSQRYFGRPYPAPITSERVLVRIAPDRVVRVGLDRPRADEVPGEDAHQG